MDLSPAQNLGSLLPANRIERVTGYGLALGSDGYVVRPTSAEQVAYAFDLARRTRRKLVLRGAGRSYGDASTAAESIVLDLTRMDQIQSWDPSSGLVEAQAGVTIEQLWRHTIEDGFWPPVVSGTGYPTLGGALAMNIHGKNHLRAGTLGEHIESLDFLTPSGSSIRLTPEDELFRAAIGSAGLLGCILGATLRLKKIASGDLLVLPVSCANWDAQFQAIEDLEGRADYLVSWVDCFPGGRSAGRGLVHAAWYQQESGDAPRSLTLSHQDLPSDILGFPKSSTWRVLKLLNNNVGMRLVNAAKHLAGRKLGNGRPHLQSLAAFSFLLDYVPNWRNAYLPGGFIQYQCFVPKDAAPRVLPQLVELQQLAGSPAYLGVLKRHKPMPFLIDYALDGYSLALDFKVRPNHRDDLWSLCHRMTDVVLDAGGKFYFAKDCTLRPEDVPRFLPPETLTALQRLKGEVDPEHLLTSDLARRLQLFPVH